MSNLKTYFVYNQRTLDSKLKRYSLKITPQHREKLKTLLNDYEIDYDKHLPDFIIILTLYLIEVKEWKIKNKASRNESKKTNQDERELKYLFEALSNGDTIESCTIKTKGGTTAKFESQVFKIIVGNWIHGTSNLLKPQDRTIITTPSGLNSFIITHPHTRNFLRYLKENFPSAKNRSSKFISDFLKIIYPESPSAKKISNDLPRI